MRNCFTTVIARPAHLFTLTITLLICGFLPAQSVEDSLKSGLTNAKNDTTRLRYLESLVEVLGPSEEGQKYNTQMGELAKTTMASKDPAIADRARNHYMAYLGNAGYIAEVNGDIPEALDNYNEGLALAKQGSDPVTYASLLNNIGFVYIGLGDIEKGVAYYKLALHIRDSLNDKSGIATSINNLASVYRDQGELDTALIYFERFKNACIELKDSSGICLALNNIGKVYISMGDTVKARHSLNEGYALSMKIGDDKEIGHALYGLGLLSFEAKNYLTARQYFESAIEYQTRAGHKKSMAISMLKLAETDLALGQEAVALETANKAQEIAFKTGYLDLIQQSAGTLKDIYKKTGQDSLALEMFELEVKMRDSITNETNRKLIIRTGLENEFSRKKAELDQKSQRETLVRNFALAGLGVVLLFLIFVIIQRNRISRERKRSDALLLNILPAAVAEELKESGHAKTQAFEEVTVLFTDFKDFTRISELLSPEALVAELDHCFKAFDEIVGKFGVEKIKTTGDAYMAAGGLPIANNHHATDTVRAAMAISDYMTELKKQRDAEGKITFEIRIGVHTGPIVAGIVGVKKFAYDVWGDTVNTASRMESSGEPGKVNISESTYQRVKDQFNCTYRGKVTAKHKGEISMYFVDSEKS